MCADNGKVQSFNLLLMLLIPSQKTTVQGFSLFAELRYQFLFCLTLTLTICGCHTNDCFIATLYRFFQKCSCNLENSCTRRRIQNCFASSLPQGRFDCLQSDYCIAQVKGHLVNRGMSLLEYEGIAVMSDPSYKK